MVRCVAKQRAEHSSRRADVSARMGYALVGLALAVAVLGGAFPHRAEWLIAAVLLWAGLTLVGRARGWRIRRPVFARPARSLRR